TGAVSEVTYGYVASLGLFPLMVSAVGAVGGVVVLRFLYLCALWFGRADDVSARLRLGALSGVLGLFVFACICSWFYVFLGALAILLPCWLLVEGGAAGARKRRGDDVAAV